MSTTDSEINWRRLEDISYESFDDARRKIRMTEWWDRYYYRCDNCQQEYNQLFIHDVSLKPLCRSCYLYFMEGKHE